MNILRTRIRAWVAIMVGSFLFMSVYIPVAHAELVSTEALLRVERVQQERTAVAAALERADVRDTLLSYGVDPTQVSARVNNLSADEIHTLATEIERMPIGADSGLGILLFVFVLLLITDILGLTDVFPFVRKHHRR